MEYNNSGATAGVSLIDTAHASTFNSNNGASFQSSRSKLSVAFSWVELNCMGYTCMDLVLKFVLLSWVVKWFFLGWFYDIHELHTKWFDGIARGAGWALNLSCGFFILIPVSRKLLALVEPHAQFYEVNFLATVCASPVELHRLWGYVVVLATVAHAVVNAQLYAQGTLPLDGPLGDGILGLRQVLFTGVICLVLLFGMLAGYHIAKKTQNYSIFWYTHLMYIPFLLLLLLHGNRICKNEDDCPWYIKQTFYRYFILPGVLFGVSKLLSRFPQMVQGSKGTCSSKVISIHERPGRVIQLTLSKPFEFAAGQYATIRHPKLPGILGTEFHPFTISSHPSLDHLVFNIEMVGDWTTAFGEHTATGDSLIVQGPFGAPAQNATNFQHLVLIGLGVGSTPMLSIANEVMHAQATQPDDEPDTRLQCALVPPDGFLNRVYWCGGSAIWAVGTLGVSVAISMLSAVSCAQVGLGFPPSRYAFYPFFFLNFIFMCLCQLYDSTSPAPGARYVLAVCVTWGTVAVANFWLQSTLSGESEHCELYCSLDVVIDVLYLIVVWNRIAAKTVGVSPHTSDPSRVSSVEFVSVNKTLSDHQWITEDLLNARQLDLEHHRLFFKLYLTRQGREEVTQNLEVLVDEYERASHSTHIDTTCSSRRESLCWLNESIHYQRPSWDQLLMDVKDRLLQEVEREQQRSGEPLGSAISVGVFYCGGERALHDIANSCSSLSDPSKVCFFFYPENFGI